MPGHSTVITSMWEPWLKRCPAGPLFDVRCAYGDRQPSIDLRLSMETIERLTVGQVDALTAELALIRMWLAGRPGPEAGPCP